MLRRFIDYLEATLGSASEADTAQTVELATAALLIEVMRADDTFEPEEETAVLGILDTLFTLDADERRQLFEHASDASEAAHDLHQFTHVLNETLDYKAKLRLVEHLWLIARADGRVDSFEAHIIRRIAGLLHVGQADLVRTKLSAGRLAD